MIAISGPNFNLDEWTGKHMRLSHPGMRTNKASFSQVFWKIG
jgi:hypothetical protein